MANTFDEEFAENMALIVELSLWCVTRTRNPNHALHILEEVRKGMQASADMSPEEEMQIEKQIIAVIKERKAQNVSKN